MSPYVILALLTGVLIGLLVMGLITWGTTARLLADVDAAEKRADKWRNEALTAADAATAAAALRRRDTALMQAGEHAWTAIQRITNGAKP